MEVESSIAGSDDVGDTGSLAALARTSFESLSPTEILTTAARGAEALWSCRVEATYCAVDDVMTPWPPARASYPGLGDVLRASDWSGDVEWQQGRWARAFPLCHRNVLYGCMVVSASVAPAPPRLPMLEVLAERVGAALACAELHRRDVRRAHELAESNDRLSTTVARLQARTQVLELLEVVAADGSGPDGIVDALHRLTGYPVCAEDKFGNLLAWSGPGRPTRHPKPTPRQRDRHLRLLATHAGPVRTENLVSVLIQPHAEIYGVVALVDVGDDVDENDLFALRYGSSVLGLELSHRRSLAEMQVNLRRELVDDLVTGIDADGAYARAEAMGYDLRRPHRVVVVHTGRGTNTADVAAVGRAAINLGVSHLISHREGLVVVLADAHLGVGALYDEVSRQLGRSTSAVGIGPRCDVPTEFPESFDKARRALTIRMNSAQPHGVSDFAELGFYHLVDAAHTAGVADEYVRQWLGELIDYDAAKNSDLVHTLSHYLECGGNYDESAAALHVHRSTLRYRLGRIAELTGADLRNVDTRFNLHAAARVWRFLSPP